MPRRSHSGAVFGFIGALLFLSGGAGFKHSEPRPRLEKDRPEVLRLNRESASHFARLALKCVKKEYPNKPEHVINDASEVRNPAAFHPAFYGCYDWHSSVHGHWMLVRLLKIFPDLLEAAEIHQALNENLSAGNIEVEVKYFHQPGRKSFERTYGWAWLLKLVEELGGWEDEDGRRWRKSLEPLAEEIVKKYLDFLPKLTYPIRRGVHPNTAFGIAFALDYARQAGKAEFEKLLRERSLAYFIRDVGCPAGWEPDGEDFFSPCLIEAELMRRVLSPAEFQEWFHRFMPGFAERQPASLFEPADVTDRSDPRIVHLDGLNLSRAWCMLGIARALPQNDPLQAVLIETAVRHAEATLPHIASGSYEGEHWLATFAVCLLSL